MSFLTSIFGKKQKEPLEEFIFVDMHSHLIPNIDDGSKSLDESVELVQKLKTLGYKKLITSPHIIGDLYKNTPEIILSGLTELKKRLAADNINIEIEAAAEYYLDEWFIEKLNNGEKLMTFGNNYVLFETSFMNEPAHLHQAIFLMRTLGYTPVLAHPERYVYLYQNFSEFKKIYDMDVLFQMNLNSLAGYYSKAAKQFAEKLIDNNMVDFVGTDCHGVRHLNVLQETKSTAYYRKLAKLNIRNNSLLS
jgi:protein-tyrosine phosphatase